jgi:catechol 2,3-dioxygenase-like lactoylglutathione lyase family enzyme
MFVSLTHIAREVANIEECIDFYRRYCGFEVVHRRNSANGGSIVWIGEPSKSDEFIFVLMSGGEGKLQEERSYDHLGFALESHEAVDAIAQKAKHEGRLVWPPRQEQYPVGYYCGVRDPDGKMVEFSYGQPLGPGAEESKLHRDRALSEVGAADDTVD